MGRAALLLAWWVAVWTGMAWVALWAAWTGWADLAAPLAVVQAAPAIQAGRQYDELVGW